MNPAVLMTVYDTTPVQHELTKAAVASVLAQDIPVSLYIIDNGSTYAETIAWLDSLDCNFVRERANISPVVLVNQQLDILFRAEGHMTVLGVPNDVILPPNLYREFLKCPRGVVTGSMNPNRDFTRFETASAVNECTPMAVVMWRKWVYDALIAKDGHFFDPRYFLYASDCDFALRLAACGIRGVQLDIQYYHYGSASHRLTKPELIPSMARGADKDRARFIEKWGFSVDAPEYGQMANDINFRGEGR